MNFCVFVVGNDVEWMKKEGFDPSHGRCFMITFGDRRDEDRIFSRMSPRKHKNISVITMENIGEFIYNPQDHKFSNARNIIVSSDSEMYSVCEFITKMLGCKYYSLIFSQCEIEYIDRNPKSSLDNMDICSVVKKIVKDFPPDTRKLKVAGGCMAVFNLGKSDGEHVRSDMVISRDRF